MVDRGSCLVRVKGLETQTLNLLARHVSHCSPVIKMMGQQFHCSACQASFMACQKAQLSYTTHAGAELALTLLLHHCCLLSK